MKILSFKPSLSITVPSLVEIVFVLLSSEKSESQIIAFLETIEEIAIKYNIIMADYDIRQMIEGLKTRRDYGKGGLFDALIAGAAKVIDDKILANDSSFDGIPGLKRITFDQFLDD